MTDVTLNNCTKLYYIFTMYRKLIFLCIVHELLGHLFYFKNKERPNPDFTQKAKVFYEHYLQTSGIFSLPIVSRIGELNKD